MKMQNNFWLLCLVVFFAALTRLLPHPANFTAVGAIALFGGTYFNNKRTAFLIPMAAMLLSDMFIEIFYLAGIWNIKGFHDTLIYVYAAFALTVSVGFWVKQNVSFFRVIAGGLIATTLFFLITNFAVWLSGYYGFTKEGLITCYIAAIPFHRNTLIGDFVYIAILFGSFEYLKNAAPKLAYVRN